jgi:hypothetical protein
VFVFLFFDSRQHRNYGGVVEPSFAWSQRVRVPGDKLKLSLDAALRLTNGWLRQPSSRNRPKIARSVLRGRPSNPGNLDALLEPLHSDCRGQHQREIQQPDDDVNIYELECVGADVSATAEDLGDRNERCERGVLDEVDKFVRPPRNCVPGRLRENYPSDSL